MATSTTRAIIKKSRYPGLVPFCEEQQIVFKGRDKEVRELYNLIVAEQLVVVYAKSGVGKSSLLYAGLFPELKKHNYYPIKIRFRPPTAKEAAPEAGPTWLTRFWSLIAQKRDSPEDEPGESVPMHKKAAEITNHTLATLKDIDYLIDRGDQPKIMGMDAGRLWEQLKLLTIRRNDSAGTLMTPVLVFDQFEELFRFPRAEYIEMIGQIAEALHSLLPTRIAQHLRGIPAASRQPEDMAFWTKQPSVKCIIAIRDDQLGSLDLVKNFFPMILKNRYKLLPLTSDNAAEAMAGPAKVEDASFTVHPFTFAAETHKRILQLLSGSSPAGSEPGLAIEYAEKGIDGSQLQKVCMHIENKVFTEQVRNNKVVIDNDFIHPDTEIKLILDNFYQDQLATLGTEREIKLARKIIEQHLVSGGARASLTRRQMELLLKDNSRFFPRTGTEDFLKKLIDARLVKEEFTHLGMTFELGHETLVKSVARYADQNELRSLNNKNFRLMLLVLFSFSCLVFALSAYYLVSLQSNKTSMSLGTTYYQQGNDYYAFNIWDNYSKQWIVRGKDQPLVEGLLDKANFFDVGLGLNEIYTGDNVVSVLERDNSINIWRMNFSNHADSVLKVAHFFDAHVLESTDSKRFIGYRTSNGRFEVIDIAGNNQVNTDLDRISRVAIAGSTGPDPTFGNFSINFIPGGDFAAYILNNSLHIYDLKSKHEVRLPGADKLDGLSTRDFITQRMRVSPDESFLAVLADSTLHVFALNGPAGAKPRMIKGVDSLYNRFKTNLLVYKANKILYLENYDTTRSATRIKYHLSSDLRISPDSLRIVFYNSARKVVVFNGQTNKADTVFKDKDYFRLTKKKWVNMFDYLAVQWNGPDHLTYKLPTLDVRNWNLQHIFSGATILNIKDTFRYIGSNWWVNKENQTICLRRGKRVDTADSNVDSLDPAQNEDPQALISRSGHYIAFLTDDEFQNYTLNVLRVADGSRIMTMNLDATPAIRPFMSDNYISVKDAKGNNGLYFFKRAHRDRSYYRKLYPMLTRRQEDSLGINNIFFTWKK
jgi:hypothetical protein